MNFWYAVKRLALGVSLIVTASAILLLSDLGRRTAGASVRRIAIVQHLSTAVHDDAVRGMLEALAARGYVDGQTARIQRFNAQGDMPTGQAIAKQVVGGDFDIVITSSTPSMQAVANANKAGLTTHVFGIVADPFVSGIGLNRANPLDHPKHMVGQSIFLPVRDSFEVILECLPSIKTIGVAWNPAESNSEAFTKGARVVAKALNLNLIEANVENSNAAGEAVNSLIARGAQALWVGGDNSMMGAMDAVIAMTKRARIPIVTILPGKPDRGTLVDIGLDFYMAGRLTGELTADVLDGADPATIPIRDVLEEVPRRLIVNTTVTADLKEPWQLPADLIARADILVDAQGVHRKTAPAAANASAASKAPLKKTWKVDFIQYNNVLDVEEAELGVRDGFKEAGLVEGRDFRAKVRNANGDMATVNGLIDAAITDGSEMLITFSTPTLQAALQRAQNVPVVFTYVANAVAAGAGTSDTDHRPNVTGVYMIAAYEDMFAAIKQTLPQAKTLGTLYVPAEVNSVYQREEMMKAAKRNGIDVISVAANTPGEVPDAALSLTTMKIDAICQIPGNLTASAFPSIAQAAGRARLPVFTFQGSQAKNSLVTVARDYHEAGRESALIAARIMRGENPASIPFFPMRKNRTVVNLDMARSLRVTVPQALIQKADQVIGEPTTR